MRMQRAMVRIDRHWKWGQNKKIEIPMCSIDYFYHAHAFEDTFNAMVELKSHATYTHTCAFLCIQNLLGHMTIFIIDE